MPATRTARLERANMATTSSVQRKGERLREASESDASRGSGGQEGSEDPALVRLERREHLPRCPTLATPREHEEQPD